MRLRASNKQKNFRPADFDVDGSEDDEPRSSARVRAVDDHDSDEGFVDQENGGGQDVAEDDEDEIEDLSEVDDVAPPRRRTIKKEPRTSEVSKNLHEVQPYPNDPSIKWTRSYAGNMKRWAVFRELAEYWFSHREFYREISKFFLTIWYKYELLPPKLSAEEALVVARTPWVEEESPHDQQRQFAEWFQSYLESDERQSSKPISRPTALRWLSPQAETELTTLLGPVNSQREYKFTRGQSVSLSQTGSPLDVETKEEAKSGGWLLDVGGITLGMGWAPVEGAADQLLAMTVIPHSDQAFYQTISEAPPDSSKTQGSIQIWKFPIAIDSQGVSRPSTKQPKLIHALCFEWGRATRMQWCPVPLTIENRIGLLAVLCADGKLRVLEIQHTTGGDTSEIYEEVQEPLATIEIRDEHGIDITCFTWVNANRIAAGLSDGSVTLWSIRPLQALQRHPVHTSRVMDICSAYPSHPFIVSSFPVGGVTVITDLNRPNAEMTYYPALSISFQPNLLGWSEHMQGHVCIWPAVHPGNHMIAFAPVRVYPQIRHIVSTGDGEPTCLSVGTCHPFVLVGSSDGSLWAMNVLRKTIFQKEKSFKLKVFQHEYRSLPSSTTQTQSGEKAGQSPRGVSRILHGFYPEQNLHPGAAKTAETRQKQVTTQGKKGSKPKAKRPKKNKNAEDDDDDDLDPGGGGDENDDGEGGGMKNVRVVVFDPLTRISAVCWNPNLPFSWWAAAAMGSGLVRIMDLGIEDDENQSSATGPGQATESQGNADEDEDDEMVDAD